MESELGGDEEEVEEELVDYGQESTEGCLNNWLHKANSSPSCS